MSWMFLGLSVFSNVLASVFLKIATKANVAATSGGLFGIQISWQLLASIGFYGLAFLSYYGALRELPLHIAHPLSTALPIIFVALAAVFLFGESVQTTALVGFAFLILGAILVGVSS